MRHLLNRLTFSFLLSVFVLAGCGSGVVLASETPTTQSSAAAAGAAQVAVSVTGSANAYIGTPVQYTATVTGVTSTPETPNTGVTWTVTGYTGEIDGSISTSGLYTPPANVPVHGLLTITATSQADPAVSASKQVLLTNPIPAIASATVTPAANGSVLVDVIGSNFMPASVGIYQWGRTTTFVSPNELKFTVPSAPAAGQPMAISIVTPAPGRTQSAVFTAAVPAAAPVAVSVTGSANAYIGTPVQYTATVTGSTNTAVTWTVTGMAGEIDGTISAAGLYTPPASVPVHGLLTITATSQADPTKSASLQMLLTNPVPAITSATLTPAGTNSFLVSIFGSNFMPASVAIYEWGRTTTFISANQVQFTMTGAPAAGTVVPISIVTPAPGRTQSPNYNVTIPGATAVSVTGSSLATLGTVSQYTAAVTGATNTAVNWTIQGTAGENDGTISAAGVYTPPATVPAHNTITITATSQASSLATGSIAVTISNPVPAISSASLTPAAKNFLVDVYGSNFEAASAVLETGSGVPTTYVSATHLQFTLTNPPAAGTVIPIAVVTPAPGRTQSANYSLAMPGTVAVTLTGSATVYTGTPSQFTATVTGTSNTAVTWTITGAPGENDGTISASGLWTPPEPVPAHGLVTLTATSQSDTTKSASMQVLLTNPVPTVTSVTMTPTFHSSYLVDVYGTNFLPPSVGVYEWGRPTTYVSGTHLQFSLPGPMTTGTVIPVSVATPAPGETKSGNFNVTVPPLVAVTVTGAATATVNTPVQYTAMVTGTTNTAVTWSVNGTAGGSAALGTISATGVYTPPATVPGYNLVTISAASTQDTTKTSSETVTLVNAVPAITSASAAKTGTGPITVSVTGSNFIPTTYVQLAGAELATTYVSPTALTATITTPQTAGAQIAISAVTPNPGQEVSASFNVTIPGAVGVTVIGSTSVVGPGTPVHFGALVTGSPNNTAVTWTVTAAGGANVGSIDETGLYTPPATVLANQAVTITATSVAEPSSTGSLTVTLVTTSVTAATRLLDQTTFGATDSLIAHVQTIGLSNYINEQMAMTPTLLPLESPLGAFCDGNAHICIDEDWWNNAVTAPDQLRQRVANALSEFLVVSYDDINCGMMPNYYNLLTTDAFGNWTTIMKDVTLSPAMGRFLNMANSAKPPAGQIANENFARENMQLFNLGLDLLNPDGTPQLDGNGNPIPTYTEAQVEAYARVFTGWTWATPPGVAQTFPNWNANFFAPMVASEAAHDTGSKTLVNTTLPAGQTAEQDLAAAIQDVFNHPNVGPFVSKQLILHLVKGNPSPAYIGRVAAVFANDGTGVRGNMGAVVKAILLDPEARAGDTATVANDGYLREPIVWTANMLRALNAVPKPGVTDNSAYTSIDSYAAGQGQLVFNPSTVFNFYPPQYGLGDTGLNAPQFALETTATIMVKLDQASAIVDNELGRLTIDLSATSPMGTMAAVSNDLLLDELSKLFLHGQMSTQMRSAIAGVITGVTDPAQRVRDAVYLVITSSDYKVIH